MRALVNAVTDSIESEVSQASLWRVERYDSIWRNPDKGPTLNIYATRRMMGGARWTGSTEHVVEIVVEYAEPAPDQATTLERDQPAELAAYDEADLLVEWAMKHEAGFAPAWRLDVTGIDYAPGTSRELFTRYCRMYLQLAVEAPYG